MPASVGAQAIGRAFEVLRLIARRGVAGMALNEVTASIDLPHATAHRLLRALVGEGAVIQDRATRRYALGPAAFRLSLASRFSGRLVAERLRPVMMRLAGRTGDTVYLVLRSGFDAICIDRADATTAIRIVTFEIGEWRPLGVGASGAALLAALPPAEFEACIAHNANDYPRFGSLTVDRVREQAEEARRSGFGYTMNNLPMGTSSIGVALPAPDDAPHLGISIGTIQERMTERLDLLKEALAAELTRINDTVSCELLI